MAPEVRIIAAGDIMLGDHPAMVGRGVGSRLHRDSGFDPMSGVAHIFRQADIALANLECPLSDWPRYASASRRECRAPAVAIRPLASSGLNALNLANNHIQQHGRQAFSDTVAALEAHGIAVVGLAGDRPGTCRAVDIEKCGLPLRLLGYSLRPRQHFKGEPLYAEGTTEGILADISAGRSNDRIVVVTLHWGDEFVNTPSRAQRLLGKTLIDGGCSLVIGHHPHVLQGWERYRHGVVFYSLGNLVFDMPWLPELRRSAICECVLTRSGCGDIIVHPILLDDEHCPRPATGSSMADIERFLKDAAIQLAESEAGATGTDYQTMVMAAASRERWARNWYFLRNLWRYRPDVAAQLIGKFGLRRIGVLHD